MFQFFLQPAQIDELTALAGTAYAVGMDQDQPAPEWGSAYAGGTLATFTGATDEIDTFNGEAVASGVDIYVTPLTELLGPQAGTAYALGVDPGFIETIAVLAGTAYAVGADIDLTDVLDVDEGTAYAVGADITLGEAENFTTLNGSAFAVGVDAELILTSSSTGTQRVEYEAERIKRVERSGTQTKRVKTETGRLRRT